MAQEQEQKELSLSHASKFIDFVNNSPTPYHAVSSVKSLLNDNEFEELSERDIWTHKLIQGGKYYVTRNGSSIIAFTIGEQTKGVDGGLSIVGAHTDSPCLKIKPISKKNSEGFIQVGVEQYGGMIAHTWFDRDLSIAGRVYINDTKSGKLIPKLIKIDKPLLRIPTLAIHLHRDANTKFEFNKETKLLPIAGQLKFDKNEMKKESNDEHKSCADDPNLKLSPEQFDSVQHVISRHSESLVELIANELNVELKDIEDFELSLFDHQKSIIGGLNDEFIFSPRLDNLTSCFTATTSLIENASQNLKDIEGIQVIALFDHEEVGSVSYSGANSSFLLEIIQRLSKIDFTTKIFSDRKFVDNFHQLVSKSFFISSDQAHGIHPNYSEYYETSNKPHINQGPVVKINANQRYATNSTGIVLIKKIANFGKVPLQLFVVKNGSPCGSTIGNMCASKLGIRTLDLGNPQLSMHSIRETGGTYDIIHLHNLFASFFENYKKVDDALEFF